MTGSTHSLRHRRTASLLAAGAVGALVLAGATACASTGKSVSVSSGGSYSGSASATSASPSASASASTSASARSSGGATAPATGSTGSGTNTGTSTVNPGGIMVYPNDQLTTAPAGTKYVLFDSAAHSKDGRTLYLGIESQGGACGKYDVVAQESSGSVSVGLIHVSAGTQMCPMYVAHMLVVAKLSAPLDGRRVIDLANGQTVASAQIG
jgi:hypothetical protein